MIPLACHCSPRHHKEFKLYASSSDGGSSGAGNNNSGGGGGGGGGDGEGKGDDGEGEDKPKKRSGFWKGWDERVAYDPEFPFKVMLEQVRFCTRDLTHIRYLPFFAKQTRCSSVRCENKLPAQQLVGAGVPRRADA